MKNVSYPVLRSTTLEPADLIRAAMSYSSKASSPSAKARSSQGHATVLGANTRSTARRNVIGGCTPGINPFDALIVGCYEGADLKFVAKVRNGFVPRLRRDVFQRFAGLESDACPFSNLLEKRRTMWALAAQDMKECHWLRPRLVAQVEFTEWTPDGHLRHASFARCGRIKSRSKSCENTSLLKCISQHLI